MRKPLIPFCITILIKIFIRRRPQTSITVFLAERGFRQGMNMDVPLLNRRQLISYLTPSTNIGFGLRFWLLWHTHQIIHIKEATGPRIEDQAVHTRRHHLHAL